MDFVQKLCEQSLYNAVYPYMYFFCIALFGVLSPLFYTLIGSIPICVRYCFCIMVNVAFTGSPLWVTALLLCVGRTGPELSTYFPFAQHRGVGGGGGGARCAAGHTPGKAVIGVLHSEHTLYI